MLIMKNLWNFNVMPDPAGGFFLVCDKPDFPEFVKPFVIDCANTICSAHFHSLMIQDKSIRVFIGKNSLCQNVRFKFVPYFCKIVEL